MKLYIVPLILFFCFAGCGIFDGKHAKVEHGLRHNILIAGEKDQHMSISERMQHHKVPAVSIAVISKDQIEWAKGYGCISSDNPKKITTNTLFQAASISKPVTALGALLLIQQGKLSLDDDVNKYLKSWKIPDNKFTKKEKVTLRRLLSHTAGTSVHGFDGYPSGKTIPSVIEILDGKKSRANSDPVRVTKTPGTELRYSGGGITIVQLLIEDVTGERFDAWMKSNILVPFGMNASTFSQPLTQPYTNLAAHGHDFKGKPVNGKWHTYPEMAAAGLWTTPTDLANFLVTILRILHGKQTGPVGQELIKEALKSQFHDPKDNAKKEGGVGLGFFLSGSKDKMFLSHGGTNEGFVAKIDLWPGLKKGLVIMTNGDGGDELINEIINSAADVYDYPGREPKIKNTIRLDSSMLAKFTGVYRDGEHTFTVNMRDNKLFVLDSYFPSEIQLYPEKEDFFFMREKYMLSLQFMRSKGVIDSIIPFSKNGKRLRNDKGDIVLKKTKE